MHPPDGYVTMDDGVRLFFQTLGNGPQTVVVPNGICLLDDFKPLADHRTLIFYDLRNRDKILQLAAHHKISAVYPHPAYVVGGGLMSYSAGAGMYRVRGAKPVAV